MANALGDPSHNIYSLTTLQTLMYRGVREYSRYRPAKRQLGVALITQDVAVGATAIRALGGPFAVGDQLIIDNMGPLRETRTVLTVARHEDATDGISTEMDLTVAPLTYAHPAGTSMVRNPTGIISLTDSWEQRYQMPFDFLTLDRQSFDLSTGLRSMVRKVEYFGDAANYFSDMIGGVNTVMNQSFQGTVYPGGTFYAFAQGAGESPSIAGPGRNSYQTYIDITVGFPTFITFTPGFSMGTVIDPVFYFGQHIPITFPDADMDALIAYCTWQALIGRIVSYPVIGQVQDGRRSMNSSYGIKELRELAKQAQDDWEFRIVRRPFALSG